MGGDWHLDLTNAVTHMLASGPGSEKYKVSPSAHWGGAYTHRGTVFCMRGVDGG